MTDIYLDNQEDRELYYCHLPWCSETSLLSHTQEIPGMHIKKKKEGYT